MSMEPRKIEYKLSTTQDVIFRMDDKRTKVFNAPKIPQTGTLNSTNWTSFTQDPESSTA